MSLLCGTAAGLYFWLLGATDVRTAGPRPKRKAVSTTASRYTMATFTSSKAGVIAMPSRVQAMTEARLQA